MRQAHHRLAIETPGRGLIEMTRPIEHRRAPHQRSVVLHLLGE